MATEIMVLDDEPIVGKRLKLLLSEEGYAVECFTDPQEAVARTEDKRFDIVITDVVMRGLTGVDVLAKVLERWPGTKVILITGYATMALAREAMRHGAYDFVAKPFVPEKLFEVVGRAAAETTPQDVASE